MSRLTDQPRWPAGTPVAPGGRGPGGGRFRDADGGMDWAGRASVRLSPRAAPSGYSWGTRRRGNFECPICHKNVSEVGHGKLATHNGWPGERCPASGAGVDDTREEILQRGGGQQKRRTPRSRKKPGRTPGPPPRPKVQFGSWLDPIDDPQARQRLEQWEQDRGSGHENRRRILAQSLKAGREALVRAANELRSARIEARQDRPPAPAGVSSYDYWRTEGDWVSTHPRVVEATRQVEHWADELRKTMAEMSVLDIDPTRPLAVYGEQLHIEGDSWYVYQALDQLEQQVPPLFHQIAADHIMIASHRGIWLGDRQALPDLDDLSDRLTGRPRGWRKDSTWADPDGVVTGDGRMAVTHTPNADALTRRAIAVRRAVYGIDVADQMPPMPPPVVLHEMGHLLDQAIGYRTAEAASEQRMWRLLHSRVKRESYRLSPYFRQKGDAGPSEFWADAFGVWASYPPEVLMTDVGSPGQFRPRFLTRPGQRPVTARDVAIAETYGLRNDLAQEISDYFERLHADLQSGRRKTRAINFAQWELERRY